MVWCPGATFGLLLSDPVVLTQWSLPLKLVLAREEGSAGGVKGAPAPRSGLPFTPPLHPDKVISQIQGEGTLGVQPSGSAATSLPSA